MAITSGVSIKCRATLSAHFRDGCVYAPSAHIGAQVVAASRSVLRQVSGRINSGVDDEHEYDGDYNNSGRERRIPPGSRRLIQIRMAASGGNLFLFSSLLLHVTLVSLFLPAS